MFLFLFIFCKTPSYHRGFFFCFFRRFWTIKTCVSVGTVGISASTSGSSLCFTHNIYSFVLLFLIKSDHNNFIFVKEFPLTTLKVGNVLNVRSHCNKLTFFRWHALAHAAAESSLLSFSCILFHFCSDSKITVAHESLCEACCLFTLLHSFITECCLSLSISGSN